MTKTRPAAALLLLVATVAAQPAGAGETEAKHLGALRYLMNGDIRFTLIRSGQSGAALRCSDGPDGRWFQLERCADRDSACQRRKTRLGELLLAAKLEGRPVRVRRRGCIVTAVGLAP